MQIAVTEDRRKRFHEQIDALVPAIASRSEEIAAGRRVPMDIIASLRAAGLYRAYVPRDLGGLELPVSDIFRAVTTLSRADGSVGWTAMLGTSAQLFISLLPAGGYAALYMDGPDVLISGSDQPVGKARRVGDAWQIDGRWPMMTGALHANWMGGLTVETEAEAGVASASRRLRMFILPAARWKIEDTWYAMGMEGTGSHHGVLAPTTVENRFSFAVSESMRSNRREPAFQGIPRWLPLAHAACQLGIAAGALDDLLAATGKGHKRQGRPSKTADSEIAQSEIGRLTTAHRAAQALHDDVTGEQWSASLEGRAEDPMLLRKAEAAGTWIAGTCREIASACFSLAGTAAINHSASLGRRWRDLQVAGQHIKVSPANYVRLGQACLGI
jgi:indole-3-acetate monooxygenase